MSSHGFSPTLFAGQVALINGATAGIAARTAEILVDGGIAGLAISARTASDGQAMRDALLARNPAVAVDYIACDYMEPDQVAAKYARVADRFGRLDILVHTMIGGRMGGPKRFADSTRADWLLTIEALFLSFVDQCHHAVPLMKQGGGGSIISVASDALKVPTPGEAIIGGGMAANAMFAKTLAVEEGRAGIRVNVVSPSITRGTRTYDRVMAGGFTRELFAKAERKARLGVPDAEDVARTVAFLASRLSSHTTGQVVSVNGGISVA